MDNTETVYILDDVVPYFEEMIENQTAIIEKQGEEIEYLEHLTEIQLEQIEGLSLLANYQFAGIGIAVVIVTVIFGWNVFNRWFFKGV